ncbi:MAG: hypothetical protein PHV99_00575 [Candidatus Pacebacteria bacterium]|nr:hypothetical protein [Candidatus Paceibacterota bacterium]
MLKARNGVRHSASTKENARFLRSEGLTHREIAKQLSVSISIAHQWTKDVQISLLQKQAIENRRNYHRMSATEKKIVGERLAPYRKKYSSEDLLKKIRDFYVLNGRIPLKREFNQWDAFAANFGSWNNAIKQAGFETNPVLFAKKFTATDGHDCDSFTEKIIDDWFTSNCILHERNYPYGDTRLTADFKIHFDILVEFFGLAGVQEVYDKNIKRKRSLAKKLGYRLVEIYPNDIYPENKLSVLFGDVLCRAAGN